MNLPQFKYFRTVAEQLSFTRAAEKLFMTQPALSRSIAALEAELGMQLFERDNRNVRLTPAGEYLYAGLPRLEEAARELFEAARQANRGLNGEVSIGLLNGQMTDPATRTCLDRFARMLPNVEVKMQMMDDDELVEGLRSGQLDVAIGIDFVFRDKEGISCREMYSSPVYMVVPKSHRLAHAATASLSDFAADTVILVGSKESYLPTKEILAHFEQMSIRPRTKYVSSIRSQHMLVEAGCGIATFNRFYSLCNNPSYSSIELPELGRVSMAIAWNGLNRSRVLEQFLRCVEEGESFVPAGVSLPEVRV